MKANAVISLLDREHYARVEELWAALQKKFGLNGIYATPFPHFTFQVVEHYDLEQLGPILQDFAEKQTSFKVKTGGLGIFNGPQPIVYIPLTRTLELSQLHAALWGTLSKTATGVNPYYQNEVWLPHISLCFDDLTPELLPEVINWLNAQNFYWEIGINNFAIVGDAGQEQTLLGRYNFGK